MNYRTHADMANLIRKNLHRIPRLPVVGIPRSGMIAASQIATALNLPLSTINDPLPLKFLLVDDSVSGGETMLKFMRGIVPGAADVTTLAVYVKPTSPKPDIWFAEIPGPRCFEWNWHKNPNVKRAVLDIDGVLCEDGDGYSLEHCANAKPLWIPNRTVVAIATGRNEEAREVTLKWLERYGVKFKEIFFSTQERGAKRTKAFAARETNATWIVESNANQAAWLYRETGLPVLCTDANFMLSYPHQALTLVRRG